MVRRSEDKTLQNRRPREPEKHRFSQVERFLLQVPGRCRLSTQKQKTPGTTGMADRLRY